MPLQLRPFRPEDLPVYAELNADPRVAEWLSGPLTPAESDEIALWANERWATDRLGLIAVERRADGRFLGMCGLHRQSSRPQDVEVAWRLAHEHWGHGYATEAGRAWLAYGFETLGLDRIVSMTDEANTRSLAVMRRLEGGGREPRAEVYNVCSGSPTRVRDRADHVVAHRHGLGRVPLGDRPA